MKKTVLLIDTNPAVQAITSLALTRIGLAVEQLTDPSAAIASVRNIRPHLVLCTSDMKGLDAFALCEQLKADKELRRIPFVLLAGGEHSEDKVREQNVDAVIFKPFKSEQLRNTVQSLLLSSAVELKESDTIALLIEDSLTRGLIEHHISKHAMDMATFADEAELVKAAQKQPFPLTVIDWNAKRTLDWFEASLFGTLIIVTYEESQLPESDLPLDMRTILRPLSQAKIERGFLNFLPERLPDDEVSEPLETNVQALLAAKISVAVYQRLLTQDALKNRSWDEASAAAGAEVLRVCLEEEGV